MEVSWVWTVPEGAPVTEYFTANWSKMTPSEAPVKVTEAPKGATATRLVPSHNWTSWISVPRLPVGMMVTPIWVTVLM